MSYFESREMYVIISENTHFSFRLPCMLFLLPNFLQPWESETLRHCALYEAKNL